MNISSGNMSSNTPVASQQAAQGLPVSEAAEAALRPSPLPTSPAQTSVTDPLGQLSQTISLSTVIRDALQAAGLSLSEHNKSVAEALFVNGMGLSPSSIKQLLTQAATHPDASLDVLCFMNRNSLPVNTETLSSVNGFCDHAQVLLDSINEVFTELENTPELFGSSLNPQRSEAASVEQSMPSQQAQHAQQAQQAQQASLSFEPDLSYPMTPTEASPSVQTASDITGELPQSDTEQTEFSPSVLTERPGTESTAKVGINPSDHEGPQSEGQPTALPKALSESSSDALSEPHNVNTRLSHSISSADELIERFCPSEAGADRHESVSARLRSALSLKPSEIDRDSVRELYHRITELLKGCSELAASHPEASGLASKVRHAMQSMEFMHDLSEVFPHIEIPVHLEDRNTNTELYVYTDGRRRRPDPHNCSAMLHLDMPALGTVDVRIRLHDQTLALDFASDESARSILSDNIDELTLKLHGRGFSVNPSFSANDAGLGTLLNEVQARSGSAKMSNDKVVEQRSHRGSKYSTAVGKFDARA